MSRRRTRLAKDTFDLLQELPWWAGAVAAGLFWLVGYMLFGVPSDGATRNLLNPIAKVLFNVLAILSLFASLISAIKSVSRWKLLDWQSDLESVRDLSWRQFEHLVGEAYRRRGYDVRETGGRRCGWRD